MAAVLRGGIGSAGGGCTRAPDWRTGTKECGVGLGLVAPAGTAMEPATVAVMHFSDDGRVMELVL